MNCSLRSFFTSEASMSRIDGYLTKNERSEDLSLWITSRVYQLLRFAQKVVLILSLRLRWNCLLSFFTSEASMPRIDGYVQRTSVARICLWDYVPRLPIASLRSEGSLNTQPAASLGLFVDIFYERSEYVADRRIRSKNERSEDLFLDLQMILY